MTVKLLTEHHLEFLSLKGGCTDSSKCQNATLLEITCRGSYAVAVIVSSLAEPEGERGVPNPAA